MSDGSLWSIVVLEKEVMSQSNIWIDFGTLRVSSQNQAWKYTSSCDKICFPSVIFSQLRRPIEFAQVSYCVHMLRYAKWEDWSLTVYQKCPVSLSMRAMIVLQLLFHLLQINVDVRSYRGGFGLVWSGEHVPCMLTALKCSVLLHDKVNLHWITRHW